MMGNFSRLIVVIIVLSVVYSSDAGRTSQRMRGKSTSVGKRRHVKRGTASYNLSRLSANCQQFCKVRKSQRQTCNRFQARKGRRAPRKVRLCRRCRRYVCNSSRSPM